MLFRANRRPIGGGRQSCPSGSSDVGAFAISRQAQGTNTGSTTARGVVPLKPRGVL
jgi:hypothetical protein